MATLEQVEARIKKLQDKADALRRQKSSKIIAMIQKMMQENGLNVADLSDGQAKVRRRGRPVGSKNVTVEKGAPAKAKRVASKQYFNPKTGATWSGFGRAPEWIVSARDRSVFLVGAQAAEQPAVAEQGAAAVRRGVTAKKVSAKKVAAKKVAAKKAAPAKKVAAAK